jgi:hypothetical protein
LAEIDGILYDVLFKRSGETSLSGSLDCIAYRNGIPCASAGLLVYESLGGVTRSNMKRLRGVKLALEGKVISYDRGPRGAKTRSIGDMSDYRMDMPT